MPALVVVALDQQIAAVVVLGPVRGGLRSVLEHRRCDVGELPAYLRRLADLHGVPKPSTWGCATTVDRAAVVALLGDARGQVLGEVGSLNAAAGVLDTAPGQMPLLALDPIGRVARMVAAAKPRPITPAAAR